MNNLLKSIVLPIADKAMKTSISSNLKQIDFLQKLSQLEISNWQAIRLRELINHAYYKTEYYRELFDNNHIKPNDIQEIQDLKSVPILTKTEIRNNFERLIPSNINSIPHKIASTGGSTGDPMQYILDNKSWSFSNANSIINWERTGYRYGDKYIALGSTSLFVDKKPSLKHRLYYKMKNKIGLNGINMSDEVCEKYLEYIKRNRIKYIYGYASSIFLLAKWALNNNKNLDINCCYTTSEILTNHYRKTIFEAFHCKIIDCYGAHDGGITAFAHQEEIFEVGYNCIVRLEDSDKKGEGTALLTDLMNYAMPLINYKIGDDFAFSYDDDHEHPYNGQTFKSILGRTSDILNFCGGVVLTGPGFTILFKDIPVEYYCIEKINSHSLVCNIIKMADFKQIHEETISSTLKKQTEGKVEIQIRYILEPILSKSGKRQYMIDNSNIK